MITARLPPEAPIETKIAWAQEWWSRWKERLLSDEAIRGLGESLMAAIQQSRRAMRTAGIVGMCRGCEEQGGSCCGAGLENHYTDVLLIINLLLGVALPTERVDGVSCFFLGDEGCRLLARHVLCINYLCREITSRIDAGGMAVLRMHEGSEIACLFQLNERILRILLGSNPDNPRGYPLQP